MYVRIHVRTYLRMYTCMQVCIYVYVRIYVCIRVYMTYTHTGHPFSQLCHDIDPTFRQSARTDNLKLLIRCIYGIYVLFATETRQHEIKSSTDLRQVAPTHSLPAIRALANWERSQYVPVGVEGHRKDVREAQPAKLRKSPTSEDPIVVPLWKDLGLKNHARLCFGGRIPYWTYSWTPRWLLLGLADNSQNPKGPSTQL